MKLSKAIAAGAIFGASAVAGGAVLIATTGPDGSDADDHDEFSTDSLVAFETLRPVTLPDIPPARNILEHVNESAIFEAIKSDDVTGYLVQTRSGGACVIISQNGTYGSGCGDMAAVAAGRVVLRLQFAETDPAVFLGVMPNDAQTVIVGGKEATVQNNVWLATAAAEVSTFTMSGADTSVTVTLNEEPSTERPAPGD